jgi:RNA polymerase sigma-70 factor (ECF subfamily)
LDSAALILGALFTYIGSVSADDDEASAGRIGSRTQDGAVAFTITHWSVVLTAQGRSPAADEALEKLCRTYWWPLYGFVRRNGYKPEEAQDLTQGFFALLLHRRDLDVVRREKGRLRSYLLVSLKNFLAKARRHELAVKRGEGRALVPLEELLAREHADLEPADNVTADRIYERRWALTLLEEVLTRLEREYQSVGNAKLFDCLKEFLSDEPGRRSQAEVAAELGMTENALKQALHRLRQRYRQLLRDEIAQTVAVPGDVEDELRPFHFRASGVTSDKISISTYRCIAASAVPRARRDFKGTMTRLAGYCMPITMIGISDNPNIDASGSSTARLRAVLQPVT